MENAHFAQTEPHSPAHEHVSEDVLSQLFQLIPCGAQPGAELYAPAAPVFRYVPTCPRCAETVRRTLQRLAREVSVEPASRTRAGSSEYSSVIRAAGAKLLGWRQRSERQKADALRALDALMALDVSVRRQIASSDHRYHSLPLRRLLCEASRMASLRRGSTDAIELAMLAVEVGDHLRPEIYSRRLVCDERAVAWAFLGNAQRTAGNLVAAREAFDKAQQLQRQGTGIDLSVVDVFEQLAVLRRDEGRFDEALMLHRRVVTVYRQLDEPLLRCRALIDQAVTLHRAGRPERGLRPLEMALERLDPEVDAHLHCRALTRLALCRAESNQSEPAATLVEEARQRCRELGHDRALLQLRWIEGKLAEVDDLAEAERAYQETRNAFLRRGESFDAVLVSLDLARVFTQQKRFGELRLLAGSLAGHCDPEQIGVEGTAILTLFRQSASGGQVDQPLVERITNYLRRLRYLPRQIPEELVN